MLSRRLAALVAAGMLERRPYSERPLRHEYVLTERGRDFRTVLLALLDFGHRHFAVAGGGTRIVDARTGATAEPILVDRRTGKPLIGPDYKIARPDADDDRAEPPVASAGLLATATPARRAAKRPRP